MLGLYLSDCGQFICRHIGPCGVFEAWTIDGRTHYQHDGRVKTWDDAKKPRRALRFCVGGYSATLCDQKKGTFNLDLCECNPRKIIKPLTGNTIVRTQLIAFRRRIPRAHWNKWQRRLRWEEQTKQENQ